jgi:NADH dehydrogenase [ubiquinone] 1 alpha subcomplex assembly factor 1
MFTTPILLRAASTAASSGAPLGFWRRSLEEFRRQANIAVKMEGLHRPTKALPLITFDHPETPQRCKLITDKLAFGGYSEASLEYVPGAKHEEVEEGWIDSAEGQEQEEPSHMLFKGNISTELPPRHPEVQRSGFAAWRTKDRGFSLFGKLLWDIDSYTYLAMRIRSDGRKYFVNIQTESIVPTDIHQHLLPALTPGKWETVVIPFHAFVRTNHGFVVEPQKEMLRQKVRSIGVGLTDRVPGPFELRVADVWATNRDGGKVKEGESGFDVKRAEKERKSGTGLMDEVEPEGKGGKGGKERILI